MKDHKPLSFGKTFLASALGMLVAFLAINILGLFVLLSLATASVSNDPILSDNFFLRIDLSHPIEERTPNEWSSLLSNAEAYGLNDMLSAIDHAASDNRVKGIYLSLSGSSLSWAQCEELRNAIAAFKSKSQKPVVAYGDQYSQSEYYLATMADTLVLHPSGMVDFRGIGGEVMFYKGLLDRLDIHVDLIRPNSNAYKSAGETYTRTDMSDANKEQIRTYLSSIWNHIATGIATSRNLSLTQVNSLANNLEGYLADDAYHNGLVDTLAFNTDLRQWIQLQYGSQKFIDAKRYAENVAEKEHTDKIAVIYAEGNVVPGKSKGFETAVYGDDIAKALLDASNDKNVKAIVLRVNSPGGAVTASETMTHAVIEARKSKPVIVSMSGVAASAGYEISCNADVIVAQPTTITGSIGVFATIPEIGTMLRKHLGITTDTVMTHRNATALSLTRPLSPTARAMMQRNVEDFYVTFCQRVASGRSLTPTYVDSIARGRVWTGSDAYRIGLVDTLGGMDLALRIAAEHAQLEQYSIAEYPKAKSLVQTIGMLGSNYEEERIASRMRAVIPFYDVLNYWATASDPLQARLPYDIAF